MFSLRAKSANEAVNTLQLFLYIVKCLKVILHDKSQFRCEIYLGPLILNAAYKEDQLADLCIISRKI